MKKVIFSAMVFCLSLSFTTNFAQAKFGVQLPFLDGHAYECMQNSDDSPSHGDKLTRYDLDFGMPRGTLIVAAAGGEIIATENRCIEGNTSCGHGFGNYIKIKHDDSHATLYAHLQHNGVIVNVGDHVIAGQPIGFSENTGHSTGPHLHFGMHEPGRNSIGKSIDDIQIWSRDRNTEQDIWRLVGISRNNGRAFHCCLNNGTPGHYYEALDINGFDFSPFQCASLPSDAIHCWRGEADNTGRYHMAQCDNANYHVKYYKNSSGYHAQELSTANGRGLCNSHTGSANMLAYLSGNGYGGGSGYADDSDTSNPWSGYAHHVGLKYLKIGKKSSGRWDGSRTWAEEEIPNKKDFRIKLKQKGGVWPDGDTCAEVWFSDNKHFTDKDLFLGKECKNLSNETRDERSIYVKNIKLPAMEAGNDYYFFTVVTYPGGINPSSEDDHDEYVKVTIVDNPNPSTIPEFAWSSAGPISGMECVQILETADPDTWNDNYFCSKEYEGIAWSSAGPISGMRCTQITEAAEPSSHTWNDNYLCVVPESNLNFYWNSAGPIPNKNCVQWLETADPHTWNDNYLCWDRNHNQPPTGFLDSVNCNQFTGWAKDPNTIGSISVHFYIDGEAGTGTYIGGVTANQHRGDLPFDDKNHGFTFRTPASIKDGHQHHIYAYGIDEQNQVNSLLNNSPLTINHCISPAVMQVIRGFYLESE